MVMTFMAKAAMVVMVVVMVVMVVMALLGCTGGGRLGGADLDRDLMR